MIVVSQTLYLHSIWVKIIGQVSNQSPLRLWETGWVLDRGNPILNVARVCKVLEQIYFFPFGRSKKRQVESLFPDPVLSLKPLYLVVFPETLTKYGVVLAFSRNYR